MESFLNSDGQIIVEKMIEAIQKNKVYLGEVDGLIGDGDHGMNMNKGFSICKKRLEGKTESFTKSLEILSDILFNEIGGSMGPIYGTLLMDMAEAGSENEKIDLACFSKMLKAGLEGLQLIVEAKVGDKTLIDALSPSCDALQNALKKNKSFHAALDEMKIAAEQGRDSTKELVSKFGRSSRLGERSRGVLDAGATSCAILIVAMADQIQTMI